MQILSKYDSNTIRGVNEGKRTIFDKPMSIRVDGIIAIFRQNSQKLPILRYLWHLYPLREKFLFDSNEIFTIILNYDRDQMTKIMAQFEQYFRFHTIGCPYFSPFFFTLQLATIIW